MSIVVTPIPRLIDLAAPAFTLGTANAAGSAVTAVASDATLLAFDTTLPDAITFGQSGAVGSSTTAARRSHAHAMATDPTTAAAGSSLVLIGTEVASDSASLTVDGLDSTYDSYMLVGSDLKFSTDTRELYMRVGDSGGIDSGATDYKYAFHYHRSDAAHTAVGSAGASYIFVAAATGNVAGEGIGFFAVLTRPGDGTTKPTISGFSSDYDQNSVFTTAEWGGVRDSVIVLTQLQIYPQSGDFVTGRFTVWGMKHA